LKQVRDRVNVMPLGSGALAGNPFGIDRYLLAQELEFSDVTPNSLLAVGDRDFIGIRKLVLPSFQLFMTRFFSGIPLLGVDGGESLEPSG
jgi:argininosuccinate lyase